jgi:hypothetical protein
MSRSRKKNPTTVDIPKGSWKHEYNSRVRATSNQLLKQIISGKIDPDELILPEVDEAGNMYDGPKEDVAFLKKPDGQSGFLSNFDEDWYEASLDYYDKAFRK